MQTLWLDVRYAWRGCKQNPGFVCIAVLVMALGIGATTVMFSLRRGLTLALLGIALGLAGGLAMARALGGLLYGVSATDPLTFTVVVALLSAAALLACSIPARRATRVDPMIALRGD